MLVVVLLLVLLFSPLSSSLVSLDFSPSDGFKHWEQRRRRLIEKLVPFDKCFTETAATEIMRIINSQQSSAVGLPLPMAIGFEYDNWVGEEWFPNENELKQMKLDEVI
jgi:hypothetical protein